MLQALRDPPLAEQLARATKLATEGKAAEVAALIDAVHASYGSAVSADDELLLGTLLAVAHENSQDRADALRALAAVEPLLPAASGVRQARFQSIAAALAAHGPGNHEQAIDTVLRALALVEEDTRPGEDLWVTLGNCGMTLARLELFPLAAETAARAIAVAATVGDWVGRPEVQAGYIYLTWGFRLEHLALTEQSHERWTTAIDYFSSALAKAHVTTLFRTWAAAARAICTARIGRIEDGYRDLAYACGLPVQDNPEVRRVVAHATGTLLYAEGRLAEARTELLRTWELTLSAERPLWQQDVAWLLGRVAMALGDDAEALRWHREMHERYGRAQYDAWLSRATAARLRVEQEVLLRRTRELESDVLSDPLTGVPNRRAFDANLPRLIASAHATATPLTLAIIDIDHFKRVNDTYGHPVGDEVLRRIARILGEQCRDPDRCARFGGDELAICLPVPAVEATGILTRMTRRIAEHPWSTIAPGLAVTASTGLAQLVPGDDAMTLFGAADQSLLAAKRARRAGTAGHPNGAGAGPGDIPVARVASSGG